MVKLALFKQLCSCHGGHGSHGRHGDGGNSDVFEDGLGDSSVRNFVLAERSDDHLAHFPAGVAAHREQRLDVLLPKGRVNHILRYSLQYMPNIVQQSVVAQLDSSSAFKRNRLVVRWCQGRITQVTVRL